MPKHAEKSASTAVVENCLGSSTVPYPFSKDMKKTQYIINYIRIFRVNKTLNTPEANPKGLRLRPLIGSYKKSCV